MYAARGVRRNSGFIFSAERGKITWKHIIQAKECPDMTDYISCQDPNGSINISDDVVAVVVTAAIREVDGVAGLANAAGGELAELFGKKNTAKGVKVQFEDGKVVVDTLILVRYGYAIAAVAKKVQASVTSALESMIGYTPVVNVHVSGVAFDK